MTTSRCKLARSLCLATIGAVWAGSAAAQQIAVPSGLDLSLYDVILEAETQTARFRFVMPAIDPAQGGAEFAEILGDLQYVCDSVVVPALSQNGWASGQIVLSVSDEQVVFGIYNPDVTQFFQPFRLENMTCVWEDF